jgi:hypothetical protein
MKGIGGIENGGDFWERKGVEGHYKPDDDDEISFT